MSKAFVICPNNGCDNWCAYPKTLQIAGEQSVHEHCGKCGTEMQDINIKNIRP